VTVDLDLDVSGGLLPSTYTEGFENAGFGTFTSMSLDVGKASLTLSQGHRCQYNDPDFANSNSYGNTYCYLGFPTASENAYRLARAHVERPRRRARLPRKQLPPLGVHRTPQRGLGHDTLKQLDAIRTTNPVNLGGTASPPS
jgi:hypothetical protein